MKKLVSIIPQFSRLILKTYPQNKGGQQTISLFPRDDYLIIVKTIEVFGEDTRVKCEISIYEPTKGKIFDPDKYFYRKTWDYTNSSSKIRTNRRELELVTLFLDKHSFKFSQSSSVIAKTRTKTTTYICTKKEKKN